MTKSFHWMVHYPDYFYSMDLRFKKPLNEREVRQYLREYHNIKRLPNETEIYTNHPIRR